MHNDKEASIHNARCSHVAVAYWPLVSEEFNLPLIFDPDDPSCAATFIRVLITGR